MPSYSRCTQLWDWSKYFQASKKQPSTKQQDSASNILYVIKNSSSISTKNLSSSHIFLRIDNLFLANLLPSQVVSSLQRMCACSLHTQFKNRLGSHGYWSWWRADSSSGPLGLTYMMLCKHEHEPAIECMWTEASFTSSEHVTSFLTLHCAWVSACSCHCGSSSVFVWICVRWKEEAFMMS